jgi:DNA-3-methyladenine glycosylase II
MAKRRLLSNWLETCRDVDAEPASGTDNPGLRLIPLEQKLRIRQNRQLLQRMRCNSRIQIPDDQSLFQGSSMPNRTEHVQNAIRHLKRVDPVMGDLINRAGPFTMKLNRDRFGMLIRSILSQQISTKAARSIRQRLDELLMPNTLCAPAIDRVTDEELRSVGLSRQKISYLRDLCSRVLDQRLRLERIGRLSDEEAIDELIQVKGIGRWTAQMFLIFSLGRLDVFPHDDLIVRSSIKELYELDELPNKQQSHEIAANWKPYSSIATWYCWRLIDVKNDPTFDASKYPV